jgi:3-phenylpropionate/trans-cinnamate dioxygenase ferredoxin reductase subunit
MKQKNILQGILWISIYLILVLIPIFIMFIEPRPEGREFWRELSVSFGFIGLAMMALQFALTTRFKWLKAPYGADIVYHFHRQISYVALALILTHPILLFIFSPDTLALLLIWSAPWRARAAVVAVLSLLTVVGLSVWRKKLKIEYNRWRIWHGIFASAAIAFAMVHILLVGHYVDLPWKRALWVGYGVFWVGLLIYTRLIKPFMLLQKPYQIVEVKQELGNAWSLVLEPNGHNGFRFSPGQFAWITVRNSPFADAEHPFSISSSAEDTGKLAFTIKELGDFTSTIKNLQIGEKVYVDGPFGSFSVDRHQHAKEFIFIAGGVGITPMMSMLRTLADRKDRRKLTLVYANREWDQITFRDELNQLKDKLDLRIFYVLEKPPVGWQGETGFINQNILEKILPEIKEKNKAEIFICGPAPMMNAVEKTLDNLGVWSGDFHSERFDLV